MLLKALVAIVEEEERGEERERAGTGGRFALVPGSALQKQQPIWEGAPYWLLMDTFWEGAPYWWTWALFVRSVSGGVSNLPEGLRGSTQATKHLKREGNTGGKGPLGQVS